MIRKRKHKIKEISIKCNCAEKCQIIEIGKFPEFEEFFISIYTKGSLKRKQYHGDLIFDNITADKLMKFLQDNISYNKEE